MAWITCDVDLSEVLAEATDEQIVEEYEDRFGKDSCRDDIRDLMRLGNTENLIQYLRNELYERKGVIF